MERRKFLEACGLLAAARWYPDLSLAAAPESTLGHELQADVVIIGGGLGGVAAALAATRMGARVIMTEETDWIGGQLTQQAVPPDENQWIESFGATRAYRRMREHIREYYRRYYPLTDAARAVERLNPGNGGVSRLCHEPRAALAVLQAMLAPAVSGGRMRLLLNTRATQAWTQGDRVEAVGVRSTRDGRERILRGSYFIDATEQGDLLPLTKTEYVTGFESQRQTGEPNAPSQAQPANIQACTWCFALDYIDGEDHAIDRPEQYDRWREHVPSLTPPWPGRLLSLTYTHPVTLEPTGKSFFPSTDARPRGGGFWHYRRIADRRNFRPGTYPSDITLVNWPMNDYMVGNLHDVSAEQRTRHLEGARQLSLSLVYWLQTEVPRPDGGSGWKGLRLRKDIMGTDDGLAKYPYIRESRRIRAEFTVLQQHVWPKARMEATGRARNDIRAEAFPDSVGIGHYRIDLHPTTGGDNYIDIECLPFQIPLGALIPARMENLIPGCKNIGVTHITNGCYRLHPVEWNIGEAAGALAAYCVAEDEPPRHVRNHKPRLSDYQKTLVDSGVELDWSKMEKV